MSEIEMNEQERMHQLLCAYVLGEAEAAERAEVEAALAKDGALREERARLEATIGLVKSSMGKDETLSWRATSEVTRAAAQMHSPPAARSVPWHRSTSLRAAASIVALVGAAYLGWRAFVKPHEVKFDYLAKLEKPERPGESRELDLVDKSKLAFDPQSGTYRGPGDQSPPRDSTITTGVAKSKEELERLSTMGYSASGAAAPAQPEKDSGIQKARERTADDAEAATRRAAFDKLSKTVEATGSGVKTDAANQPAAEAGRFAQNGEGKAGSFDWKVQTGEVVVDGAGPGHFSAGKPSAKPLGATGSDEYFLGRGAAPAPAEAPAAVAPTGLFNEDPSVGDARKEGAINSLASQPAPATRLATGGGGGGPTTPGPNGPGAPSGVTGGTAIGALIPGAAGSAGGAAKPRTGGGEAEMLKKVREEEKREVALADMDETSTAGLGAAPASGDDTVLQLEEQVDQRPADELTEFERLDRFGADSREKNERGQSASRRILTPEERRARVEQIIASCRPLPNERPRDMFFRFWGDNAFEWTANDRQSTFAMDVDTASYTLARKYLVENHLPEKAQIRTEEFVNYFKPDVAPPAKGTFAIATELAPSRYSNPRENKWMLRVAVRGREIPKSERDPLSLTLVVDVSGSMKEQNRLELVKHAMRQLVGQLDARDSIAIVAFSADSRLMLPMTSAARRDLIESAINPLTPDGGTNTEAGLRMGYEQALAGMAKNTINRVVLLTDGVANVGVTDPDLITQGVERQRKAGIYLNTIGVGMNNHNDHLLEQLADKGDGVCNYVDDAGEVKHVMVDEFLKTLVPIARDAKVQVEFDPAQVESYRLLGYENRAIADQDFRNDKVDAGEINAGHQITALYEIVRTNLPTQSGQPDAPLATVRLRFKPPHKDGIAQGASEEASEVASPVLARNAAIGFDATSFGYRRAVIAAQFAEFLRRSVHSRGDSLDQLIADSQKLAGEKQDAEVAELSDMIVKSRALLDAELLRRGQVEARVHELRMKCYEQARLDSLHRESDRQLLRDMDREIASLENDLRRLMDEHQVK